MNYSTLIQRLKNLYLPDFYWPVWSKGVLNPDNFFRATHHAAINYIVSVAKSRDGHDIVNDNEMNVVKDILKVIYFVFASNSDFLHIHNKVPLHIDLRLDLRHEDEFMHEDEFRHKYNASSFPYWVRYIDRDEEQEIFRFLYFAYYECIEHFPEYCDPSLQPFFIYLIERFSTDNLSSEQPVDLESLTKDLNLPIASVRNQVKYFKDRVKTLENQLSKSERENDELREQLIETSNKLCESEILRFGIPDREYLVRINNGFDFHLRVFDSTGKVLKLIDIESTLRDVISESLGVPLDSLTPEACLDVDSLDAIEIIMKLERIAGIEVKDDEFPDFSTFGDVLAFARAKIPCSVEIHDVEALDSLLGDSYEII